ncbi:MAG: DegQ family serine endoprotease [Gammaproteobacteria bacterium]|nr:DegQ family serine endoprotease [Gammaproteobacteria bacterium]
MMKTTRMIWSGLLLAALALATANAALPDSVGGRPVVSLAPLVEAASPAVVNIRVSQTVSRNSPFGDDAFRRFFGIPDMPGGRQEVASAGSGVIVDAEQGYILTNHHVVGDADTIQISLIDGKILDAEIVGSDPATDIAVIKVDADGLTDMPIGNSDGARVGDFVIAIGNPFGLGHTVTSGIISALGRTGISRDGYEDFIQTDASINPGNSGGALVNMNGELIGINSAIISRSGGNVGIGFAVPTEIASSIMRQILDFGEIRRGLLGVGIQTIDAENAEALESNVDKGVLITNIVPKSAAEEAGLEVGDIIVEVNGKNVDDAAELRNTIGLMRSGDEVAIKYVRDSRNRSTKALLGQAQSQQLTGADIHPGLEGAVFAEASTTSDNGIEVVEVAPGSPAAQRGLRPGDIITAVNRNLVRDLQDLVSIAENNRILFLLVQRGDRSLMLQIR